MLGWYVQHDGRHFIFARSERAAVAAFAAAHGKEGAAPRGYWCGTVVAPPRDYLERYARHLYDAAVRDFQRYVVTLVKYERPGRERYGTEDERDLAFLRSYPGLRACSYAPPPEFGEPPDADESPEDVASYAKYKEECARDHERCANGCYCGALPATGSWSAFYETRGRAHCLARSNCGYIDQRVERNPKLRPPRADLPAADPARPLLVLGAQFGHHEPGLGIRAVDLDYSPCSGEALFFFQGEEFAVPAAVGAIVEASRAEEVACEKRAKADRFRRDREERDRSRQALRDLFRPSQK